MQLPIALLELDRITLPPRQLAAGPDVEVGMNDVDRLA